MKSAADDDYPYECPLCTRKVPRTSAHHLKPKSRGGSETLNICLDCHGMIHALFPNKQLERQLSSVEELKSHPEFARYLTWIARRNPERRYRATRSKKTRRRGRSG
ncbi:MAG: HNH endonuclease [Fuerstiella sp.]